MNTIKRSVLSLAGAAARWLPDGVKQEIYRHPALARPLRRALNRAAPGGLGVVEVAAGGLVGMKLELDLQAEKTYWLGTYEPELQAAIADLVQPGWVVYDVGANIGYITLLLAQAVGETGYVYAFEPLPENLPRLQRNLELNGLGGRVECFAAAVIDQRRDVDFLAGPSHKMGKVQGSAGQDKIAYGAAIRVPGFSLDEFAADVKSSPTRFDQDGYRGRRGPGAARYAGLAGHPQAADFPGAARTAGSRDGLGDVEPQRISGVPYASRLSRCGEPGRAKLERVSRGSTQPERIRMSSEFFAGRVGLQQRVLPEYRGPFLDALAAACHGGLGVFAGQPQAKENIASLGRLEVAVYTPAHNRHLLAPDSPFYFCWQPGLADWLEDWQPQALIVEANSRYLSTPKAIEWMHSRGRPVLGWGLGAPPQTGRLAGWRLRSRQRFLQSLDGLIAYSRRGAAEYAALGISDERIFVASNAVTPRAILAFARTPAGIQRPTGCAVRRALAAAQTD